MTYLIIFLTTIVPAYALDVKPVAVKMEEGQLQNIVPHREWLKAFYTTKSTGSFHSKVRSPQYFLTEHTHNFDPLLEMNSFISAYTSKLHIDGESINCRFPYRTKLMVSFGFMDPSALDFSKCDELSYFLSELGQGQASFVFVSQYYANPASVMGHIFLHFSNPNRRAGDEEVHYLNQVINFAAHMPPKVGTFSYVFKGIFGLFPGMFSMEPFSDKAEKYSNMESRDLYIYNLNIDNDTKESFLLHLYELLRLSEFSYYFFDENCAYYLLAALEVVLKEDLTHNLGMYALPIDVIRILDEHKLTRNVIFQPSIFRRLQLKKSQMTRKQKSLFKNLVEYNEATQVTEIEDPLVLETGLDQLNLVDYKKFGKVTEEHSTLRKQILRQRSKLGSNAPFTEKYMIEEPHKAHGSKEVGFAYVHHPSYRQLELSYRLGIHGLMSNDYGMPRFSAIEFAGLNFAYDLNKNQAAVKEILLGRAAKLVPEHDGFGLVWDTRFAFENKNVRTGQKSSFFDPRFHTHGSLGLAKALFNHHSTVYILAHAEFQDQRYRDPYQDPWALGGRLGFGWSKPNSIKLMAEGTHMYDLDGNERYSLETQMRLFLNQKSISLGLGQTSDVWFYRMALFLTF
jgi:hypothetical protein